MGVLIPIFFLMSATVGRFSQLEDANWTSSLCMGMENVDLAENGAADTESMRRRDERNVVENESMVYKRKRESVKESERNSSEY